mgnify:CR=1 FL=1
MLEDILVTLTRITGAYFFAGFLYNLGLMYEYRLFKGYKKEQEYMNVNFNEAPKTTRIAVMIPAFKEENVIGRTLDFLIKASEAYDPRLVKIYVGTYPNDPGTRKIVKQYERLYPIVEEVVNSKNGPTTKAQNLNNIYSHVNKAFEIVGIHDAEDFIPNNILLATNYYYQKIKDNDKIAGIQFAVRAKKDNLSLTNLMYLLMFRFNNLFLTARSGKSFIPSHGTATYYKQSDLELIKNSRGYIWDEKNFTEDFELSLYKYFHLGKTLIYVPYPYVEEYFPSSWKRSIKQIARWQYGNIQALKKHFLYILKKSKLVEDLIYSSSFGFYSLSLFWILMIPSMLITALFNMHTNYTPLENIVYTINTFNGIRWMSEGIYLIEKLKLNDEKNTLKRISKNILFPVFSSFISSSANIYMIKRYLLTKNKIWSKTEHK